MCLSWILYIHWKNRITLDVSSATKWRKALKPRRSIEVKERMETKGKHWSQGKHWNQGQALESREAMERAWGGHSKNSRVTLDVSSASEWRKALKPRKRIEVKASVETKENHLEWREALKWAWGRHLKRTLGHTRCELCVGAKEGIETNEMYWREGKHGNQGKHWSHGKHWNQRQALMSREALEWAWGRRLKEIRVTLDVSSASEWRNALKPRKNIQVKENIETIENHGTQGKRWSELEEDILKKQGHTRRELCVGVNERIETMETHWVAWHCVGLKESIETKESIEVRESIETKDKHWSQGERWSELKRDIQNKATLDVSFASEWRKALKARKRIEVKGSVGVSLRETLKTKKGHTQGELCVGVKEKNETMQKHWVVGEHWNQGNVEVKESDEQCQSQKKASDALHGSKSVQNGTGKRKKRKASQSKSWGDRLTIPTDEGNGEVANVRG